MLCTKEADADIQFFLHLMILYCICACCTGNAQVHVHVRRQCQEPMVEAADHYLIVSSCKSPVFPVSSAVCLT